MADSVYKSRNLTRDQLHFLKRIEEEEILYFQLSEIEEELNESYANLNEILENLVEKGVLIRLEKGKYCKANFNEPNVLASFISHGGIIAYWSALHIHNLTDRFPNTIFIKTDYRKRNTSVLGSTIQFVYTKPEKRIGTIQMGYGQNSYVITDKEATLIDCFDQPRYAGDWPDLLRALHQADINSEKMIEYTKIYQNQSLIKRIGYLAELFNKKKLQEFIDFALTQTGKRYILLEPGGPDNGAFDARWKIRLNIDDESIKSIIEAEY
ncbi:MAG TPA: hypothetical protein VJ937_06205 [Salinivirga sp.]|uniref:type IV toxin-antitoxin system AbiEi family antitoxin domain-containing protein n=1 Tax=Salinivirga sp. TaxID=1970192 RepID=UPI002B46D5DA|nr:hypothetical protein [Salinivirga sp.]HKK59050.1 hypothetical protein [Salinivirga sp.]